MKQFFSYYLEIYCVDDELCHEVMRSDDFSEVQDLFLKLAVLDLPVAIRYDTWWSKEEE